MKKIKLIFLLLLFFSNITFVFAISTRDYDRKSNPFSLKDYGYADPFVGFKGSKIAQPFLSNHYKDSKKHLGADFMAPAGTVLYSICDGVVLSDSLDMTENKIKRGRKDNYLAYFHSRLFIQCEKPKKFLVIYGHIDKVQNYLGKNYIGKRVYKGQAIGKIAPAYNEKGRDKGNDHLHLGINIKGIKFFYGARGWGIAKAKETEQTVKAKGYVDPFEFLMSQKKLENLKAYFNTGGSVVYATNKNKFGGNIDVGIMYPNNLSLKSAVVFQWFYDPSTCPYLKIYSPKDILDVYISVKPWYTNEFLYTFKYKLDKNGVIIRKPNIGKHFYTIVIVTKDIIKERKAVVIKCSKSYKDVYKKFIRPTPKVLDVTGNYIWTGTGSLISSINDKGAGITEDYVIAVENPKYFNKKVFATFQWEVSNKCKKIKIEAICLIDGEEKKCNNKFKLYEIKYKRWYNKNWENKNISCHTFPCYISNLPYEKDSKYKNYYIIKIKGDINYAPSAIKIMCVK